jgi:digeranylgeranylglycerophospholipid reductase
MNVYVEDTRIEFTQMYDVVVIGAGPCGSMAAGCCAEAGLSTLCIEEHAAIGYPVQCAGLLSCRAFNECDVSERSVLNRVSGARICYGNDQSLTFDARVTKAYVVDRGALDLEMAIAAGKKGAVFSPKTYAYGIRGTTLLVKGMDGRREIPFRILIAADGPRSSIARLLGMERARLFLSGIQADVPGTADQHLVEIHPHASPDFFGWAIPTAHNRSRIGLCGQREVSERFLAFASRYPGTCTHLVTGTIPLGVMPRTYGNRTLFVGDAAGFAKPTSGGGIYTGVRSARIAARVAIECCARGAFDDRALSAYEKSWKSELGRELALGLQFLRIRQSMAASEVDRICEALNDPHVLDAIVQYGDMDHPSVLLRHLAKRPALIGALGILFRAGVAQFLKSE